MIRVSEERSPNMARNVQAEIVDSIIESLEQGVAPWHKPWQSLGCQRNVADNRHYRGANAIWLSIVQEMKGYELPLWVTFEGAKKLGGNVKKGQRGTPVYWICPKEREKTDKDGNVILDDNGEPKMERYWKTGHWIVFNVAQTTIPREKYEHRIPQPKTTNKRDADIEAFLSAVGLTVKEQGDVACYDPMLDEIRLPKMGQFNSSADYYSTSFHEHGHATGHKSRLGRGVGGMAIVGREQYAEEELVAELTAAFLGAEFQLDGRCQHAEYIGHWLKALKDDRFFFYRAVNNAKKAAEWLQKAAEKGEAQGTEQAAA